MYRKTIAEAYDAGVEEEYNRLKENSLGEAEYLLITELLDDYLPICSTIIDIGSGPGRYAEHLLKRNCKVGVVDLSAKALKAFSDRMENTQHQSNIIFNQVSCATHLYWIADHSADAILLMGPLYHLIDEAHRTVALTHCQRILKPGGYLFTVFLTPFLLNSTLARNNSEDVYDLGQNITYTLFQGFRVPQFRCWPKEAKEIMAHQNFETLGFLYLDDIKAKEISNRCTLPPNKYKLLNDFISNPESRTDSGKTQQYMFVNKKR